MDDDPAAGDPRVATVVAMWSTYREAGVEAALVHLHPEVSFVDEIGRAYRGHDGVRGFFAAFDERGKRFAAFPYSFELRGDDVLVAGHREIRGAEERDGGARWFVHTVRDGVIVRAAAHRSRTAALADVDARG